MKIKKAILAIPAVSSWMILGIIIGAWVHFSNAWVGPTESPAGGNVGAPINTSQNTQVKSGGLGIGGLLQVAGNGFFQLNNNVAQADLTPAPVGTAPEPGSVLTAVDTNGTAAWVKGVSAVAGSPAFTLVSAGNISCPSGYTTFKSHNDALENYTVHVLICASSNSPSSYQDECFSNIPGANDYGSGTAPNVNTKCPDSCASGYKVVADSSMKTGTWWGSGDSVNNPKINVMATRVCVKE